MKLRLEKHEILDIVTNLVLIPETTEEYQLLDAIGCGRIELRAPRLNPNQVEMWIPLMVPMATRKVMVDLALTESPVSKAIREGYADKLADEATKDWKFDGSDKE